MDIHFTLRDQGGQKPVIVMQAFDRRFEGRKFIYSMREYIDPKDWVCKPTPRANDKKKVNGKKKKSWIGFPKEKEIYLPLIEKLNNHKAIAETWGRQNMNAARWSKDELSRVLKGDTEKQFQNKTDFFALWKQVIAQSKTATGTPITDKSRKHKEQTLNLVTKFSLLKKFEPSLENIDLNFYHAFDKYMETEFVNRKKEVGLDPNTRGRHFKEIKAFLRQCEERDIHVNQSYKKKAFRVIKQDVDDVYFSEEDIRKLIDLERNLEPAKAELCAHIIVACWTGLRYSDWWQHDPANIVVHNSREMFKVKQQKTGQDVYIPLHPVVKMYLNKYGKPAIISNQKMNEKIKEFCKDAKLNDPNKSAEVSCHTTRRTFCTLAYLSKMAVHTIMQISGHKTEKSFLRYLKLGPLEHAILAAEHNFFTEDRWTGTMRVA